VSPLARTTDTEIFAAGLFRGRTALITGGGTGIGLAIARELGRLGASVVIAARRRDILDGVASELCEAGIDATALTLNIRDELAVEALLRLLHADQTGWPKAARDYARWATYEMDVQPLPAQFETTFAAMALLFAGLIALLLLRRVGLYLFAGGLVLKLYASFPSVPAILSGMSYTLDALAYMLAGFILAYALFGGVIKQARRTQ